MHDHNICVHIYVMSVKNNCFTHSSNFYVTWFESLYFPIQSKLDDDEDDRESVQKSRGISEIVEWIWGHKKIILFGSNRDRKYNEKMRLDRDKSYFPRFCLTFIIHFCHFLKAVKSKTWSITLWECLLLKQNLTYFETVMKFCLAKPKIAILISLFEGNFLLIYG